MANIFFGQKPRESKPVLSTIIDTIIIHNKEPMDCCFLEFISIL